MAYVILQEKPDINVAKAVLLEIYNSTIRELLLR